MEKDFLKTKIAEKKNFAAKKDYNANYHKAFRTQAELNAYVMQSPLAKYVVTTLREDDKI
jgi:hypothetical protein